MKACLSDRVEIDTLSFVVSKPGAPNQHWHRDVAAPFKDMFHQQTSGMYMPSHGFVMVVPTDDVPIEKGPTQMALGSHIVEDIDDFNPAISSVKGDCILFDLRLSHRGTENRSDKSRSITYISYVLEWFVDRVNFRESQSRFFDEFETATMRKLMSRIDARHYIESLEEKIEELGGDLSSLQTETFKSSSLFVYEETL